MTRRVVLSVLLVPLLFAACRAPVQSAASATTIQPNENRKAAGTLKDQVLTVHLEARNGKWYPEGPDGRALDVAAWAEPGGPMQAPGPLIRVPVGTEVRATLKNTLDRKLNVSGFGVKRGIVDTTALEPGAEREVKFTATTPGTYYYYARSTPGPYDSRRPEDSQLNGAIVVDSVGAPAQPTDRVFVLSWWFVIDSTSPTGLARSTMAINGLSWPHTEHLTYPQGDSVKWHVINVTESDHPMHLHGFYFQMQSKGDGTIDSIYTPDQRRLAVTEIINPGQTMTLAWLPTRVGNWIYHCHFAGHLDPGAELDTYRGVVDTMAMSKHMSDRPHQMFGLVMGITVTPKGEQVADTRTPRPIRLVIREKPHVYGKYSGYAFVMDGTSDAVDSNALTVPGPALILRRGERVAVTVVNHSLDRAAVHWHGIELESYPDGVPGWSGSGKEVLPSVGPGDSTTVRFSAPRAGTFMYHSHFNENEQITGGLYGPIIVLDSGEVFNPETDRVMMFSSAGPVTNVITGVPTSTLLNGKATPAPIELHAGTKYRFRMIDLTGDVNTSVTLANGKTPVQWRAVAKDGAALPANQATMQPAKLYFDPGEIYDFEYTPAVAGRLSLTFGMPPVPPPFSVPKMAVVPVTVR
jgi:FtsP/CotA-like multicopper oxidase with cupredoxin domain